MPSAAPDPALIDRFRTDLTALLRRSTQENGAAAWGVALSGGPDSCALLLLAAAAFPGRVEAMTVDHGLRAEAAAEAQAAAALCADLSVPHETARVTVGSGSVQAAAREVRYAALADWAGRRRLSAILTAHHADDQAETLLMRLARGSGLAGLAGVRAVGAFGTTPLLRPLLGWRKSDLEAICASAGIVPARDPSNEKPRYDRTAARALLAGADWIDPRRVAASASHLAEAEEALDTIAGRTLVHVMREDGEDCVLRPDGLAEIDRRMLRRLFAERFGKHPDGPALERLLTALQDGRTVTCADILCRSQEGLWRFRRAPPRRLV